MPTQRSQKMEPRSHVTPQNVPRADQSRMRTNYEERAPASRNSRADEPVSVRPSRSRAPTTRDADNKSMDALVSRGISISDSRQPAQNIAREDKETQGNAAAYSVQDLQAEIRRMKIGKSENGEGGKRVQKRDEGCVGSASSVGGRVQG